MNKYTIGKLIDAITEIDSNPLIQKSPFQLISSKNELGIMYMYVYICMYINIYILYVCMNIHIYIYIYIYL
jgi:hypothetical protein